MEEQLFQDCRALQQSATYDSNISDSDRVVVQPCLEYPADESTMEDNANAVDETNNAASPENVSSSDYAEATDAIGVVTQILTLNCQIWDIKMYVAADRIRTSRGHPKEDSLKPS
ncbi:hypothetical protein OUZ56_005577 [Daphnia magna]|uniref:Uncharacterized protein n=1 Tax=Daphnia magna TaxID=35525 RepID=A0ABQ9YT68_9CRUS|nr:hypothetical protein OUZ56_005577 [Daphnia magna]